MSGERVVVVGAGIAGLAAAFRLKQAGCNVTVLERCDERHVGGRMASFEHQGFHIDFGALLLPATYRSLLQLIADAGLSRELLTAANNLIVLREGNPLRMGAATHLQLLAGLSKFPLRDVFRIMSDLRRIKLGADWVDVSALAPFDTETMEEYRQRRGLDAATFDHLLEIFSSTNTMGDPARLSWMTPFLFMVSAGGVPLYTSKGGVGFVAQGLAKQLHVEYGAQVVDVEERGDRTQVTWSRAGEGERVDTADACIIATPAPDLLKIYPQIGSDEREYLSNLEWQPSLHVAFGLDTATAETAPMTQIPRSYGPHILGFVAKHNFAPGRVPSGKGLVMCYMRGIGSRTMWEWDDAAVMDSMLSTAKRLHIYPELQTQLAMTHVCRVEHCVIARNQGSYRHIARIAPLMRRWKRVRYAGGEYLALSGMNASACSGEDAARHVLSLVRGGNAADTQRGWWRTRKISDV